MQVHGHQNSSTQQIGKILIKWVEFMRSANLPITGLGRKDKAAVIARSLGLDNFKAFARYLD
jgi:hypothetical protein